MLKFPDRALTTGSRNGTGFLGYIRSSEAVLRRHSNNDNTLIEDLRKDWGCKPGKGGGKNWLEFPPLSELRRKFNEKYGDQDWGEGWESEEWLEVHSKGFMPEDE
jgi:hypothetical protein